ncbi:MAG: D-alanyl-D-alanine carboxypeptidase [Oscillospiraceae bacterium]|nr:D-alanyl-D-alanine carboxypeptidase [Oscillospiraceae bacterium]
MKKRHFFTTILVFILIVTLTAASFAYSPGPGYEALAVLVADMESGDILYASNEHTPVHPASTTKIMTALLAVEALDRGEVAIHDILTTSETALYDMVPAGSSIELEVGEEMSFESLLYAAMLVSANDASNVIAEHLGGTIDGFVRMMNERAYELGAVNTTFRNPHGLTEDGHITTAYDMFRISEFANRNPRFVELYSQQERPHAATNMRPAGFFRSTNFMTDPESPHYFPGADGIKTGFTSAAGFALVSTATRGDVSLMAVVMGVPAEDEYERTHFTESALVYDWAFATFSYEELLSVTYEAIRIPVEFGEGTESVGLRPLDSITALVRTGTVLEDSLIKEITIFNDEANDPLVAPINRGEALGEMVLHFEDRTFGPIPLVAAENVSLSRAAYMENELMDTLSNPWVLGVAGVLALLLLLYIAYVIRYSIIKRRRRKARMGRR